jgi:ADP-ribose pyrophosphatase YjhB (NUDIX family)
LSAIIRESAEEASFDSDFIRSTIRSVGAVSYPNRSPDGWILPGFYYLFELPLQDHAAPKPRINTADGEVDAFNFMTVAEVLERLVEGKFKPSSALALVDFLIRHGHVTDETDTRFAEICMSLRRDLVLPIPW